jgi:hypothetical protein
MAMDVGAGEPAAAKAVWVMCGAPLVARFPVGLTVRRVGRRLRRTPAEPAIVAGEAATR